MQDQLPEVTPKQAKTTMYLIFAGYTMLTPVLWFLASNLKSGLPPAGQIMAHTLGGASLLGAAVFAGLKLRPTTQIGDVEPRPAGKFQAFMLISLAISEMAMLFGFALLPGEPVGLAALAVGNLIVNLGVILPRINAYWQAYEQANGPL